MRQPEEVKPNIKEIQGPGEYIQKAGQHWVRYQGLEFWETMRQPYGDNNCIFAAGIVDGAVVPEGAVYIWIERDGVPPSVLVMQSDEMTALVMVCSSALWVNAINQVDQRDTDHG